jgi:hypothetical protein
MALITVYSEKDESVLFKKEVSLKYPLCKNDVIDFGDGKQLFVIDVVHNLSALGFDMYIKAW